MQVTRRRLVGTGLALGAALIGRDLLPGSTGGAEPSPANAPWGPLRAPDENGMRLPPGFTSRIIARAGDVVPGTTHRWHELPDGGATFAKPDGGWVYVSNSEVELGGGGAGALSFSSAGDIDDAYSILTGTSRNCAGGATPRDTWLSCEENGSLGRVYECDPFGPGEGVVRPGLGSFSHEAAATDPTTGAVYLTEDHRDGRLYRFVPTDADSDEALADGVLWAAIVDRSPDDMTTGTTAQVTWSPTSPDEPDRSGQTSAFRGGEGAWVEGRRLLFTTKYDSRVWSLDLDADTLSLLHDCVATPGTPLDDVDNVVVHPTTGDIFVAEDIGTMELCALHEHSRIAQDGSRSDRPGGELLVSRLLQIVGQDDSEVTGPAFSPDGTRLYLSSQRGVDDGNDRGLVYEVVGPFLWSPDHWIDRLADQERLRRAVRLGA